MFHTAPTARVYTTCVTAAFVLATRPRGRYACTHAFTALLVTPPRGRHAYKHHMFHTVRQHTSTHTTARVYTQFYRRVCTRNAASRTARNTTCFTRRRRHACYIHTVGFTALVLAMPPRGRHICFAISTARARMCFAMPTARVHIILTTPSFRPGQARRTSRAGPARETPTARPANRATPRRHTPPRRTDLDRLGLDVFARREHDRVLRAAAEHERPRRAAHAAEVARVEPTLRGQRRRARRRVAVVPEAGARGGG
jgi:hypothetical protein